jgi:hypothetical protein
MLVLHCTAVLAWRSRVVVVHAMVTELARL